MAITNADMIKDVVASLPNLTNEAAKQMYTDWIKNPGKMFQNNDSKNFLDTLSTFILDSIRIQDFYNPLETEGVIRRYAQSFGNIQRMYVPKIKAVDADFQKSWVDGTSSDMFKKRTIKPSQKFAYSNISYNNRISVPGNMFYTTAFTNSGGIVDWNTSVLQSMLIAYDRWRFALYMDIIGRQTASESLQDSQTINVSFADINKPTADEAAEFAKAVMNFKSTARLNAVNYNEDGFEYSLEPSNIKILVRIGFKPALQLALKDTYNPEIVNSVINSLVEVPYLGVPTYYTDKTKGTKLYPVYNADGMVIGLNPTEGQTTATVQFDNAYVEADDSIVAIALDTYRISYVYADEGELRTEYTIYNIEGDYRNLYLRVLGNPSEGSGARLFADTSYAFVMFKNA